MSEFGTRLETDDEVRQALERYRPPTGEIPRKAAAPSAPPAPPVDQPPLFRPSQRPGVPILIVMDDGEEDGEIIRIRKEIFVIGRGEGDLVIPHDGQMSARHAEIRRVPHKGKYRWQLVDLGSTNGTFARATSAVLEHGQEFLVGQSRFRFDLPTAGMAPAPEIPAGHQTTRNWQTGPVAIMPILVSLCGMEDGPRLTINKREVWFGSDAGQCQVVLANDPFVSRRHARLVRDESGRWQLENNRSPNGVWLRVEQVPLKGSCQFLLGEQRFKIRIPG